MNLSVVSRYSDLLRELVVRDLKVRYSRPLFGFFWAFLLPVAQAGIFFLIFSVFLKIEIVEVPFILYVMSSVVTWRIFHDSVMQSVTALLDNRALVKESRFPHPVIPLQLS